MLGHKIYADIIAIMRRKWKDGKILKITFCREADNHIYTILP